MIVEDEDGRALKFRTRTRVEYARVRPGMVTEAVLVRNHATYEAGQWKGLLFSFRVIVEGYHHFH